jgi:hypothetical protein
VFFLLTGCNLVSKKPKDAQVSDITGTEGLTITIPKLPEELLVGQGLEIPVTVENVGAHKVENGILAIAGYDDNFVKFRSLPKIEGITLEGKSALIPTGERTTKIFTINSINLPNLKEKQESFEVLACYQYKTEASPIVCVNPKLAYGASDVISGCKFQDAQVSTSQGAPIAVTKVEIGYFASKQEIDFKIFVKDVSGKGVVMDKVAYGKRCLSRERLATDDINTVYIETYLSGEVLTCYTTTDVATDKIKLDKGEGTIHCKGPLDQTATAFTTPLSIFLDYGYVVGKTFSIKLKNPSIT